MLLVSLSLPAAAGDCWPDGSVMDKWFFQGVKPLRGREARRFVITSYGASCDTAVLQTLAIQKAIDAAFAAGGGTVVIPEGKWLSGALFFKPGTHLLIEKDAVLKGSTDISEYPDVPVHIEGVLQPYAAALVNASACDGFSIRGSGIIDGAGLPYWKAFWARRKENRACTNLEVRRPRMVSVSNSANVTIEGVSLLNSGFWNVHLYKCNHVLISGVRIDAPVAPVKAPSSDGVDIDACSDVHICKCSIATGDDLVAIKGGKGPWADTDPDNGPNARILVEDCDFGHGPGVLVFGSECVRAENIILRNSKVSSTERLLWLKMRPDTPQRYSNILIDKVSGNVGSIIYVKPWTQFFDLKGRSDIPRSYASDVHVRNCTLKCRVARKILEAPDQYELENIVIEDNNKLKFRYNKDESKVGRYSLPDPLVFADGRKVSSPEEWGGRRREILDIFQREMYGIMPPSMPVYVELLEEGLSVGRTAVRRQYRMTFSKDGSGPVINWLILCPRDISGPFPAIMMLNFYGNHTVLTDKEVIVPDCWLDSDNYAGADNKPLESARGALAGRSTDTVFPVDEIISRGYAFVTACYGEVSADPDATPLQGDFARGGVYSLWNEDKGRDDDTGSLMAWAWALCRGMDMLENNEDIDASRVVVTGCSRLGKAALLAGAFDERFAVVVPNQTGGGGVPLSKRNFGESVSSENEMFRHWWCRSYSKYSGVESTMPFDQHMLLSCVAPRALLVEGFNHPWFDTYGEFLSLQAASPVWTFLGVPGLPDVPWPDNSVTSAIGPRLGYVRRAHKHGLSYMDWKWLLDFADGVFDDLTK